MAHASPTRPAETMSVFSRRRLKLTRHNQHKLMRKPFRLKQNLLEFNFTPKWGKSCNSLLVAKKIKMVNSTAVFVFFINDGEGIGRARTLMTAVQSSVRLCTYVCSLVLCSAFCELSAGNNGLIVAAARVHKA